MPNPEVPAPSDSAPLASSNHRRLMIALTVLLCVASLTNLVYWTSLALKPEDTEASESPLLLAIARQLTAGPTELYGPFKDGHRLVLIHAPLYYNLATLLAWPLTKVGCDPVLAALITGRSISFLSLALLLPLVFRLTRLDGARPAAGLWATLLVVGSPILGGMPFSIRPDMLGILFQTLGILCSLKALRQARPQPGLLYCAFAAFGIALCVKQHFVAGPAVSLPLAIAAWRRGQLSFRAIERSMLLLVAIVGLFYGAEELISHGYMALSVLGVSGAVGRIAPGGIERVSLLWLVTLRHTVGLTILLAAAATSLCLASNSAVRKAMGLFGMLLISACLCALANQFRIASISVETTVIVLIVPFLLLMVAAQGRLSQLLGSRFDATLWLYVVAEFSVASALWWLSTGAWFNYSIQGSVLLAVLVARATARAIDSFPSSVWPAIPLLLAALTGLVALVLDIDRIRQQRTIDNLAIELVLKNINRKSSEIYFVGKPGANRLHGNASLVYDPWLYPIFEATRLAEPRAIWLERALTSGAIQAVVNTTQGTRIDDLKPSLYTMGFQPDINVGPLYVWLRPPSSPSQASTPQPAP